MNKKKLCANKPLKHNVYWQELDRGSLNLETEEKEKNEQNTSSTRPI